MGKFLNLLLVFLLCAGCVSVKHDPKELLIPITVPLEKPPEHLSDQDVKSDIKFLVYALRRGYAGKDYLPANEFDKMMTALKQISGEMTPETIRDKIDDVLLKVPDSHLHARFNNKWSKQRDEQSSKGTVGENFYKGSDDKPWAIETRKIKNKNVLLISLSSFPFHESPVWKGFLEKVQKSLWKSSAAIIDLRGNGGGDDTTGLNLAWIFNGGDFSYSRNKNHERKTPEAQALYSNIFAYRIASLLGENKKSEEFLLKRYKDRIEKFQKARAENSDGYSDYDQSTYQFTGVLREKPKAFAKPIYILVDRRCASSCESTIDAFENIPHVKKVGENTAGFIHFGNVSPVILPKSKVLVQIGIQSSEYVDQRFIEKTGIKPDLILKPGIDALKFVQTLLAE